MYTKATSIITLLLAQLFVGTISASAQKYRLNVNDVHIKIDVTRIDSSLNVIAKLTSHNHEKLFFPPRYAYSYLGDALWIVEDRLRMKMMNYGDTITYRKTLTHADTATFVSLGFNWLDPNHLSKREKKTFFKNLKQLDSVTYEGLYPVMNSENAFVRYPLNPR